jgi:hypothetical protein
MLRLLDDYLKDIIEELMRQSKQTNITILEPTIVGGLSGSIKRTTDLADIHFSESHLHPIGRFPTRQALKPCNPYACCAAFLLVSEAKKGSESFLKVTNGEVDIFSVWASKTLNPEPLFCAGEGALRAGGVPREAVRVAAEGEGGGGGGGQQEAGQAAAGV